MSSDAQQRLDLPAPIDEIGPRRMAFPRLRKVSRIGGPGWWGYIYRGVDHPRLSRMEYFTKSPRGKIATWYVDDKPARSLEHALATINTTPAPAAGAP